MGSAASKAYSVLLAASIASNAHTALRMWHQIQSHAKNSRNSTGYVTLT